MNSKFGAWLLGGGFVTVWIVTLGFIEWRSSVHANEAVVAAGGVSPSQHEALQDRVQDLEILHEKDTTRIEKDNERIEDKAERIAQILMED